MTDSYVPRVVTIAGTDPTGGAGAQADIKAITVSGGFALSAITALVSQNTMGVRDVYAPAVAVLAGQLRAISDDVQIDAVKIGMLGKCDYIATVSDWLRQVRPPIVVLDPVMVATSGDRLLDSHAEDALRQMLPLATVVTPNIPELEVLVEQQPGTIRGYEDAVAWARRLAQSSGCLVMVKGGHLEAECISNAIVGAQGVLASASSSKVDTRCTHGTGCSISAALATRLAVEVGGVAAATENANTNVARDVTGHAATLASASFGESSGSARHGQDASDDSARPRCVSGPLSPGLIAGGSVDDATRGALQRALTWATEWIHEAIVHAQALHVGCGNGPIDHSHRMRRLERAGSVAPWRYQDVRLPRLDGPVTWDSPVVLTPHVPPAGPWTRLLWDVGQETLDQINRQRFVTRLCDGTLGAHEFTAYQRQDAIYLGHYGRALASLAARARSRDEVIFWANCAAFALRAEGTLHHDWLQGHATGAHARLATLPSSPVTCGYTDFLLARTLDEYVVGCAAVLPCFWLYCEVGQEAARANHAAHPYHDWLSVYGDQSFVDSTGTAIAIVERAMEQAGPETRELAVRAFLGAAEWEREFFAQAEGLITK